MWRTSLLGGLLASTLLAQAPAAPEYWLPDPRQWKLELLDPLGGWGNPAPEGVRVRLTDPTEPKAPPEPRGDDYWERRWARRQEALKVQAKAILEADTEAPPEAKALFPRLWMDWNSEELAAAPRAWAALLRARRLANERRDAAEQAHYTELQVWFNGHRSTDTVRINEIGHLYLQAAEGENRLEIREPRSGQQLVRTWWGGSRPARLRIIAEEAGRQWSEGRLEVLEPSGKFRKSQEGFAWVNPVAGTYTLRWTHTRWNNDWRRYRDEDPDPPRRVRVEVLLDGGSDRERRWHFEALILPGAGATTLGSFDVETD